MSPKRTSASSHVDQDGWDPRDQFSAPGPWQRRGEVRALREVPRLVAACWTTSVPRQESGEVLVVPGLGTNDISTVPLRRYLRRRGYRCHGWGLGTNHGRLATSLPDVAELVDRLSGGGARPITVIGQSLGGVYVREAARNHPDRVAQVITLGTPLWGPRYTVAASHFSGEIAAIEALIEESNDTPIEVPVTAFYSPRDGVVDWRSCIDTLTPKAENIEVLSTHFGMGLDPDVWAAVLARL